MKITSTILVAASLFCLAACSKSETSQETQTATLEDIKTDPAELTTPAAGSTAQLNPPHGEPGHSCAVPVGQPLTDAAAANQPTLPLNTDVSVMTDNGSLPASDQPVAPGMNPPHGQPGHDCAVPVGAPLKK